MSGDPPGDQWMVPSSNAGTIRLSGTSPFFVLLGPCPHFC